MSPVFFHPRARTLNSEVTLAGQGPNRRELLQALTLASAASAFAGFARWSFGLGDSAAQAMTLPVYHPQFFSLSQFRTVELLVDLILPAVHETGQPAQPGAREAGVAEFVDFMVFSDQSLQAPFRDGLAWLDHAGTVEFATLGPDAQQALLERLAYKAKQRPDDAAAQAFFRMARKYTVMGFYTTRIGLESLDYPGLKFYTTSPGCTHNDNPEHVGL